MILNRKNNSKSTTQKIVAAMSIITAVSTAAAAGYKFYCAVQGKKCKALNEKKLDDRLADSMDASDATAVY